MFPCRMLILRNANVACLCRLPHPDPHPTCRMSNSRKAYVVSHDMNLISRHEPNIIFKKRPCRPVIFRGLTPILIGIRVRWFVTEGDQSDRINTDYLSGL